MTTPPTTSAAAPPLGVEGQRCSNCDAALRPDQRYCLECGRRRTSMRLPFAEIVAADLPTRTATPATAVSRGDRSPLVALGSLIALLLALGIGVLLGRGSGPDPAPAARATVVTVSAPAAVAATATPAAVLSDWPAGRQAFTISLQALASSTPPADVTKAKTDAAANGAAGAGVLISDEHPSLEPAQFVIFSGTYATRAKATSALKRLRTSFPDASVVRVADKPASSPGSSGAGAKSTSGSRATPGYGKSTKKLPDKIETGGTAPPVDDKPAGGGSTEATEIG